MNTAAYSIRPLFVKDHHALVDLGILGSPYRAAREQVHAWLELVPASLCYAVCLDGALRGAVCCFVERGAPFAGRIHFYLEKTAMEDVTSWIPLLLDDVFQTANIHRLELLLPRGLDGVGSRLQALGFERDGRLRDALPLGRAWQDADLFAILREEQGMSHYAFIPFDPSVLAIYGDAQKVTSIEFLQYGEKLERSRLFDTAYAAGIIDSEGVIVRSEEAILRLREPASLRSGEERELPKAVGQAVTELREYLSGTRETFSFPIEETIGTPFQRSVWHFLREIPYGQTRSYMEIALAHVEREEPGLEPKALRRKAQNLSRAVGMACGANPLSIATPCHRVVGQNRKLTGFGGGIPTKAALLDLELLNSSSEYNLPYNEGFRKRP